MRWIIAIALAALAGAGLFAMGGNGSDEGAALAPAGVLPTLPDSPLEVSQETTQAIWESQGALIVDVREPQEYAAGHIPGVPLIPMDQVADRLMEIPEDQPVIFTCRTGRRSLIVAEQLKELGYDHVYSHAGGITAWQAAGLEVELP